MTPDVWVPSTSLHSVDGNSNTDAKRRGQTFIDVISFKRDQWTGLFGEGGYLWGNIDPAQSAWPLTVWCFLTGYMSVILFLPLREK